MSRGRHWLNEERLRIYPRIFLALFGLTAIAYPLFLHGRVDPDGTPLGADFLAFWSAGVLALRGQPSAAYDLAQLALVQREVAPDLHGVFGFYNPPPFLVAIAPLALLPYLWALAGFSLTGIIAFVRTLRTAVGRRGAGTLIAAFPGLWYCLISGQNALFTAALAGGAITALKRHPGLSGVLVGCLVIKPHLAILFPLLFVTQRQWRALVAAAVTAGGLLGASITLLGPAVVEPWLSATSIVTQATEQGALPLAKMPSTFAWLLSLRVPPVGAYSGHAVVALVALWACWRVWRNGSVWLSGAALMTATFLVTPYAFDYDLAWLAFPIAWLAVDGLRLGWHFLDREALVLGWVLPILGSAGTLYLHVPMTPLGLAMLLWTVLARLGPSEPAYADVATVT